MSYEEPSPRISDYMTVREAAVYLGVSPSTLRNWDRKGKLAAVRNPINRYRLYVKDALEELKSALVTAENR